MADFDQLSPKQQKAIAALLASPTITAAAQSCGIAERTIYTWLDDATFTAAYKHARRDAVQQAIARIQQTSSDAVDVLHTLMTDTKTPAAVRLNAAKTVLEMSVKAVELEEIEERLARLEERQRAAHALNVGRKLGQF